MLDNLNKYHILLASKSPRRRDLLKMLEIPFDIAESIEVEETYPNDLEPVNVPVYLATLKAEAYRALAGEHDLVITADTVVINRDRILGKPENLQDAKNMLKIMSGHTHTVVTGVCLTTADKQISFDVRTEVEFASLTIEDIDYYIDNFKPLDKAGAYGIQEWIGAVAVRGIKGSFYNVMGLPVHQLYIKLKDF